MSPATTKRATKAARPKASTPFYTSLSPMLATLVNTAPEEPGWLYEVKWDGYRAIAFKNKRELELKSRNNKSFNDKFYPVYTALQQWNINAVLDGEIVVINKQGRSQFEALQGWRSEADGELLYYVFDILWHNGRDLTELPLIERKAILEKLIPANDSILRFSNHFHTSGKEFMKAATKMGLEGIIAKKEDSAYLPGARTREWLKIKANKRQEVVIGGYTINEGSSKPFSSLLVGVFEKGKFIYTGKIGTGFNIKLQKELMEQFKKIAVKKCPFNTVPDVNKPSRFRPNPPKAEAYWVKPSLICEVSFAEMTSDGVMRHPSFEGMRSDKKAKDVVLEEEADTNTIIHKKYLRPGSEQGRKTLLNPSEVSQVRKVGKQELKFTNLNKIFWPKEKVTKRDLVNYYFQIAPFILPYLKDRPQSLNRFPNGINGKNFYQKDVTGKVPAWIKTYRYYSEGDHENKHYMLGDDEATLLYMANLGCIELNPWSSTVKKPDHPTWCIIDLDPDKQHFNKVIEAALVTKQILDGMDVPSYCKTSGSTGLHIYIPLNNKYTYDQSQEFARAIATMVHKEIPRYTSIERKVANRNGKMYLDFLQNRAHATLAAPYSLRPKPGATVSMPLHWEEVKPGMKMTDFTIFNAAARALEIGDIFKPVLGKGIDLKKILKKEIG